MEVAVINSRPISKKTSSSKRMEPQEMKTYLRIPYERAPEDPSWLMKAHAGRKLDPIEAE